MQPKKPLSDWSVDEVTAWFEINFPEAKDYKKYIEEEGIDGEILESLSDSDLEEVLQIKDPELRRKLLFALEALKGNEFSVEQSQEQFSAQNESQLMEELLDLVNEEPTQSHPLSTQNHHVDDDEVVVIDSEMAEPHGDALTGNKRKIEEIIDSQEETPSVKKQKVGGAVTREISADDLRKIEEKLNATEAEDEDLFAKIRKNMMKTDEMLQQALSSTQAMASLDTSASQTTPSSVSKEAAPIKSEPNQPPKTLPRFPISVPHAKPPQSGASQFASFMPNIDPSKSADPLIKEIFAPFVSAALRASASVLTHFLA